MNKYLNMFKFLLTSQSSIICIQVIFLNKKHVDSVFSEPLYIFLSVLVLPLQINKNLSGYKILGQQFDPFKIL